MISFVIKLISKRIEKKRKKEIYLICYIKPKIKNKNKTNKRNLFNLSDKTQNKKKNKTNNRWKFIFINNV